MFFIGLSKSKLFLLQEPMIFGSWDKISLLVALQAAATSSSVLNFISNSAFMQLLFDGMPVFAFGVSLLEQPLNVNAKASAMVAVRIILVSCVLMLILLVRVNVKFLSIDRGCYGNVFAGNSQSFTQRTLNKLLLL
jgi:uncharacterized membrane protein (DUF485 family)